MKQLILTLACMICAVPALADTISQTTNSSGVVSTIVQSPEGTTVIETKPGKSITTKAADGTRYEMDSDNSVYQVFPDGARTAVSDGQHMLLSGEMITVKDGKRIP